LEDGGLEGGCKNQGTARENIGGGKKTDGWTKDKTLDRLPTTPNQVRLHEKTKKKGQRKVIANAAGKLKLED